MVTRYVCFAVIHSINQTWSQIQSNPYMDNFGLVYHTVLQGVLCTHHHILLKSSYIHRHIQDEHARMQYSPTEAKKVIQNQWHVPAAPLVMQPGFYPQVEGLPILLGYECGDCNHVTASVKTIERHVRTTHNVPFDINAIHYVPIQRFHKHAIPFPIIPAYPPTSSTIDEIVNNATAQVEAVFETPIGEFSANNRLVSPWLLATKWPQLVQGRDLEALSNTCQKPVADDTVLQKACVVMQGLMDLAIKSIPQLPELVLQRLNTPDRAKTQVFLISVFFTYRI